MYGKRPTMKELRKAMKAYKVLRKSFLEEPGAVPPVLFCGGPHSMSQRRVGKSRSG